MSELGRCEAERWDGRRSDRCGEDAKVERDGKKLCGRHAAGARRSAAVRAKHDEKAARDEHNEAVAKKQARRVAELTPRGDGFSTLHPNVVFRNGRYVAGVVEVDADELIRLLEVLERLNAAVRTVGA